MKLNLHVQRVNFIDIINVLFMLIKYLYLAIGYIKKPKLHKKQKNRKLTNVDIHIDQDGPVVRNSQLGV